jgi:hypothetical protein
MRGVMSKILQTILVLVAGGAVGVSYLTTATAQ